MKNRKTIIVAFVLVACMLVGVGYAAVTNVLDIQGSATVSATAAEQEFNEDVYFTGVVVGADLKQTVVAEDNQGYTANINTNNKDKGQFTVTSLEKTDDSVKITYRIVNMSEHEATVKMKTITNTNGSTPEATNAGNFYFDYYFGSVGVRTATIPAGQTVDVTVIITLDEQPTSAVSASFTIELDVTAGSMVNQ